MTPSLPESAQHSTPLANRLRDHLAAHPHAHLRDAAAALDAPELAVLQVHTAAEVTPLRSDDWPALLASFGTLGDVRTMTRNASAVIERTGHYLGVEAFGTMGQAVGPEIEVRAFFREWHSALAVRTRTAQGPRRSIQLFDASGDSIHKVFVAEANLEAFDALVTRFQDPAAQVDRLAPRPTVTERPDAEVDVPALHVRWDAMQDSHEFHGMLRSLAVTRTQALRLAGPSRARRVTSSALERVLEMAAATGERLMIFVGNRGLVQIHIGTIHKVMRASGWLNVLDPRFNLHVRDADIASAWIVTKRSSEGPIQSLELFDDLGSTMLQIFGKRTETTGSTPVGFKSLLDTVLVECAP
jgi:putative hemin transport protein